MKSTTIVESSLTRYGAPVLAIFVPEDGSGLPEPARELDAALGGAISRLTNRGDFSGRSGQTAVVYPREGEIAAERVLLVGLGRDVEAESYRRGAATAVKRAGELGADYLGAAVVAEPDGLETREIVRAIVEGAILGGYVFDELKSPNGTEPRATAVDRIELVTKEAGHPDLWAADVRVATAMAEGENLARRLGNLPPNIATPTYMVEQAREVAGRHDMSFTALGRDELERQGFGALLSVARGSQEEPFLIVLEHRKSSSGKAPIVLVGKGVTFDSGGISIKPSQGMEEMKFDMCGAAAVLGAMEAIGALELAVDVVALLPVTENLPSGSALKPGDIVRSLSGTTIEVVNTDAEGRLILADALSYAKRYQPAAIVDAATLTGACVVALGNFASGAFTNDQGLLYEVRAAGERVFERIWPLPLFEEYRELLRSDYADLKNSGGRAGGAITGAWFLREFVGDTPWVHLDVAGTASGEGKLPYQQKGATGVPTRLLAEWLLSRAA